MSIMAGKPSFDQHGNTYSLILNFSGVDEKGNTALTHAYMFRTESSARATA